MSIEKELIKVLSIGAGLFLFASLMSGCDNSYDLSKLDGDVSLFENGVKAPIGDTEKFYLGDFITESDILAVKDGRYVIEYSGEAATSLDIPAFQVPTISPNFSSITLDFYESVPSSIREALSMLGYQHGDPIPDISGNPILSQMGISLVVPELHTMIEEEHQSFDFTINNIPEQLVNIQNIDLDDDATIVFKLHAEGFPQTLDEVEFEFLIIPPVQMHIDPMDETVYLDDNDHFYHIKHRLPVVNGKLDDEVVFHLNEFHFDPVLERESDGSLNVAADLRYKGRIDIDHSFDLSGWVPVMNLDIALMITECNVETVEGRIQASVDPIAISQSLEGLPDLLTDPTTCIDLENLTIALDIDNGTPASLVADLALESTFHDGTTSGLISTLSPIVIEANKKQTINISNEEQYAGEPGYIPNLNELMYKIPQNLTLSATPSIPPTDVNVELGKTFNVGINYSLNVPVAFGPDFALSLKGDFGNLATDISSITEIVNAVELYADIESALPLTVEMKITPVDAQGNTLKGITLKVNGEEAPLTVNANDTTPLHIEIIADSENELHKLYTVRFELNGKAGGESNELRPDQYLQINNIVLGLPNGITFDL